jgi:hypothetical protein
VNVESPEIEAIEFPAIRIQDDDRPRDGIGLDPHRGVCGEARLSMGGQHDGTLLAIMLLQAENVVDVAVVLGAYGGCHGAGDGRIDRIRPRAPWSHPWVAITTARSISARAPRAASDLRQLEAELVFEKA